MKEFIRWYYYYDNYDEHKGIHSKTDSEENLHC